jgi:hypothetical protein
MAGAARLRVALRAISDKLRESGIALSHQGVQKVLANAGRRAAA